MDKCAGTTFLGSQRALGVGALSSGNLDVEQEKGLVVDSWFGFCPGVGGLEFLWWLFLLASLVDHGLV
jgi:hypothetical protein